MVHQPTKTMNPEDYINGLEAGNFNLKLDPNKMLMTILMTVTSNRIALNHIIVELYPNENERKKIVQQLNKEISKKNSSLFADLSLRSEGQ